MIAVIRTNSENSSFVTLVRQLDAHLTSINGDADAFYSQYNKIDSLKHVLVAFENETPVAYTEVPDYGQYVGVDNSVCFAKELTV